MEKINKTIDFSRIEAEYEITEADDDITFSLKERYWALTEPERRIFTLYMEYFTYAGVAKALGCSNPTARKYIKQVLEKMKI